MSSLYCKPFHDPDVRVRTIRTGIVPVLIVSPARPVQGAPGILWMHGGGYILGSKEMVFEGRALHLVKQHGAVVLSPGYRLAWQAPYPAAVKDCYRVLLYLYRHAEELGVRRDRIMVGGESAGGGLAAAVCMLARDRGEVPVAFQMPLYPMLSNLDTETSRDNHGKVWNTRRNHIAWRIYLRERAKKKVSPYAAPGGQTDFHGLPPAYTFVGDGEPFYAETMDYIRRLREAGIPAKVDVYHADVHAFDRMRPREAMSREAIRRFEEVFAGVLSNLPDVEPVLCDTAVPQLNVIRSL